MCVSPWTYYTPPELNEISVCYAQIVWHNECVLCKANQVSSSNRSFCDDGKC